MKKLRLVGMLLALLFPWATELCAQTTAELLQKGIYLQETVGDLDSAIKLYRQVAEMAKQSRANSAQALYRLGICLQKKGLTAEANRSFHQLIQQYPEQGELVANARQALGSELQLLPAPWTDGEVLDLGVKLASGKTSCVIRYSIKTAKDNPGNWLIESRSISPGSISVSRTEVDKETMKPVSSTYLAPSIGMSTQATYQSGQVQIDATDKAPQQLALRGQEWDNQEAWAAIRRLPLAPGYSASFTVVTLYGGIVNLSLSVPGTEEIETPAGKFHCFKVRLSGPMNQTLWYSADASRYLVKIDAGVQTMSVELKDVTTQSDEGPSTYRNEELGFSLSLPAGWIAVPNDLLSSKAKQKYVVQFVQLDSMGLARLTVNARKGHIPTVEALRTETEHDLRKKATEGGDFSAKFRPGSWQPREIDGLPALAWIEDSINPVTNGNRVEYHVKVKSETMNAKALLKADPKDFDAFRASFDTLLETLKLR
jgi:hypothetical protein